MEVYEAIVNKRDTRSFSPDPVSDEDLQRVLQAGRMAGSAKNQQLNRIVVVTDPEDRAKLAGTGKFADWIPGLPSCWRSSCQRKGARSSIWAAWPRT